MLPLLALPACGWLGGGEPPGPALIPDDATPAEVRTEGAHGAWIVDRPVPAVTATVIGQAHSLAPWVIEGTPEQLGDQASERTLLWQRDGTRHTLRLAPLPADEGDTEGPPEEGPAPEEGATSPHGPRQAADLPPRTLVQSWDDAWSLEGSASSLAWRPGREQVDLACLQVDGTAHVTDTVHLPAGWSYAGGGSTVMARGGWLLLALDAPGSCDDAETALRRDHEVTEVARPGAQLRWDAADGTVRATAMPGDAGNCKIGLFWAVKEQALGAQERPPCGWPWDADR